MSLDYDFTKVSRLTIAANTEDGYLNDKFQCIVFASLTTNIPTLTEDNFVKAFSRYSMSNQLRGWENYLTVADFGAWIGLSTNVREESDTEWVAHLKGELRTMLRRIEKDSEAAAAE